MAHTNETPNYGLSQFIGTDKASWLGDINPDMSKIDTAMQENKTSAESANTLANSAQQMAQQASNIAISTNNELQKVNMSTDGIVTNTNPSIQSGTWNIWKENNNFFMGIYGGLTVAPQKFGDEFVVGTQNIVLPKVDRNIYRGCTIYYSGQSVTSTTDRNTVIKTDGSVVVNTNGIDLSSMTVVNILCQITIKCNSWF